MKKSKHFYIAGNFAFRSDVGKVRTTNEDCCFASLNEKGNVLLLVCDGMGGCQKGEFASHLVTKYISFAFLQKGKFSSLFDCRNWLKETINKVNSSLYKRATSDIDYYGMGTTLSLAIIYGNKLLIAHLGDSRIYMTKNKKLVQLSDDQTYTNYLLKKGAINEEQALIHPQRHVLTNAVGIKNNISFIYQELSYQGESLLLCSDGLYNNLSSIAISSTMLSNSSPKEKVDELINLSNAAGGSDNIAVVIWESK